LLLLPWGSKIRRRRIGLRGVVTHWYNMQSMQDSMQIRRLHKHHNSCVVTMPRTVLRTMEAKPGDYILFKEIGQTGEFVIARIEQGDYVYGTNKRVTGKQDKSGRS